MNLVTEVAVEKIETRADGTMKITLGSQEMNDEQLTRLFAFRRLHAFCLLSSRRPSKDQINALEATETTLGTVEGKSPSKRLRNVLYVLWEQQGGKGEFTEFYEQRIGLIINQIKERLD